MEKAHSHWGGRSASLSINSNVIQKHSHRHTQNDVQPNTREPPVLVKVMHETNGHSNEVLLDPIQAFSFVCCHLCCFHAKQQSSLSSQKCLLSDLLQKRIYCQYSDSALKCFNINTNHLVFLLQCKLGFRKPRPRSPFLTWSQPWGWCCCPENCILVLSFCPCHSTWP